MGEVHGHDGHLGAVAPPQLLAETLLYREINLRRDTILTRPSIFPVSTLDLVEERVGGGDGDPDVGVHAPDDGLELGVDIRGVARVAWVWGSAW